MSENTVKHTPDVREWQDISTAPAVGKKRLLFRLANGHMAVGFRLAGTETVRPNCGDDTYLATHWMPLPPAPQEKG